MTPKKPGWYRTSATRERWWDGQKWTNQYRRSWEQEFRKRGSVRPVVGVALLPVRATLYAVTHVWL